MTLLGEFSLIQILLTTLVVVLAGFVHGTLGLGFPMVATPLLALMLDVRVAILITLLPTAVVNIASLTGHKNWREVVQTYWPVPVTALVGSYIGTRLIAVYEPEPFQLLLAFLVFLFLASNRFKPSAFDFLSRSPHITMPLVGLVAGFAAGTTNVMVPIMIIYSLSLSLSKNTMVQLFNLCFLAGKVAQIIGFGIGGTITTGFLLSTTPFAIAGFIALLFGARIRDQLPTETFMKIVRGILLVLGILLIVQVLT